VKHVLKGGTLFSGTQPHSVPNGALVIDGDRIEAVLDESQAGQASFLGARVTDCQGKFIIPGLIDSHVHLSFAAGPDHGAVIDTLNSESDTKLVLRQAHNAHECLRAGITTVRDCGDRGLTSLSLRDAIADGLIPGPRILASGPPITTTGGHCHYLGLEADGVTEVVKAARFLMKNRADFIKVMASGGRMTAGSNPDMPQYTEKELAALVEEAHRLGRKVAAHVLSAEAVRRCQEAGVDTIEHCEWREPGGSTGYDPRVAEKMAAKGIFAGLTFAGITRNALLIEDAAERERALDQLYAHYQPARNMKAMGVRVMLSSDAGVRVTSFADIHLSLQMYCLMMDAAPAEALLAMTKWPAEALGLADEIGTLEEGKKADILILNADPLQDIGNMAAVHMVIRDGKETLCARGG